jgi:hypothetical protein
LFFYIGGNFIKVKEPEPKKRGKGKENTVGAGKKIGAAFLPASSNCNDFYHFSGPKSKPSDIRKFLTNNGKPTVPQKSNTKPSSSTTAAPNRNTKNNKTGGGGEFLLFLDETRETFILLIHSYKTKFWWQHNCRSKTANKSNSALPFAHENN